MIGIGLAWASIMGNPYVMLAGSIPPERVGVYMGIFNMFIVIPMMIQIFTLPLYYRALARRQPGERDPPGRRAAAVRRGGGAVRAAGAAPRRGAHGGLRPPGCHAEPGPAHRLRGSPGWRRAARAARAAEGPAGRPVRAAYTCCRSSFPSTGRTPASTPSTTPWSTLAWATGTTSAALSADVDLMADMIVNHVSSDSPQFRDFSTRGAAPSSPGSSSPWGPCSRTARPSRTSWRSTGRGRASPSP